MSCCSSALVVGSSSDSVTVKSARMPSPFMPGLQAVKYVPAGALTVISRLRFGPMFSTSETIRSPSSPSR